MKNLNHPTAAELYALEQWAHRERSKAQAEFLRAVFSMLNKFFRKALAPSARTVRKHVAHHA